jgi:manganese transport protein
MARIEVNGERDPHEAEAAAEAAGAGRGLLRDLFSRELFRYLGPGFVVTIGFIDPGNWATNIAGGSQFGFQLLWIISVSTLMLIFLQHIAARLGIVSGRSLAANVRSHFSRPWVWLFGGTIMAACVATQLAEYLGAALGFALLLHIPVYIGAPLTLVINYLLIAGRRYDNLERVIVVLLAVIALCYIVELYLVHPDWGTAVPHWAIPSVSGKSILVAMGMLGAIVMPHNIYLHSDVILSREWNVEPRHRVRLMRFELVDTTLAMGMGWMVNSAMIIVAAAVFFRQHVTVDSIAQASETLRPLAGSLSQMLFGIGLLAAGISSSVTSTLATANVVCSYLGRPADPHSRLFKRAVALFPIMPIVIIAVGFNPFKALILSQVVLSLQLPLTIVPLLLLARRQDVMGELRLRTVGSALGWLIAVVIIGLNLFLLYQTFFPGGI